MPHDYPPPLDELLTFGRPLIGRDDWHDYTGDFGLGEADIPGLVRMATDPELVKADSDSDEVWAPVHAWRALGQLRAKEAIAPLIALLRESGSDDWSGTDLPTVFAMIGADSLPPLADLLADVAANEEARLTAASGLTRLALRVPEVRTQVVDLLSRALDADPPEDEFFNGHLVNLLLDLNAVEAAPVMERAFAAGRVDLFAAGDWEDVQIELGLLEERITPPPPNPLMEMGELLEKLKQVERERLRRVQEEPEHERPVPGASAAAARRRAAEKARKKMAKKSRKQNRRR